MAEQYHKTPLANSTVVLARFLTANDLATLLWLALLYSRLNLLNLQDLEKAGEQEPSKYVRGVRSWPFV